MYSNKYTGMLLLGLLLTGCATLVEGTSETVSVLTDPPGASCTLERNGNTVGVVSSTPGSVRFDRSGKDLTITCTKAGFQDVKVSDSSHMVGATFGNVIAGGLIGVVVDAASGANFEYVDEIRLAMSPSQGAADPPPDHARCPARGMQAGRTDATAVLYEGPDTTDPDACLISVGEKKTKALYFAIVPVDNPDAAAMHAALKQVLYGPPGTKAEYTSGEGTKQWTVSVSMTDADVTTMNDRIIRPRRLVLHKRQAATNVEGDDTIWLDPIDGMPIIRTWVQTSGPTTIGENWTVRTLGKM